MRKPPDPGGPRNTGRPSTNRHGVSPRASGRRNAARHRGRHAESEPASAQGSAPRKGHSRRPGESVLGVVRDCQLGRVKTQVPVTGARPGRGSDADLVG